MCRAPSLRSSRSPRRGFLQSNIGSNTTGASSVGGISDRHQEISRRRRRRKKLVVFKRRLKKATVSERAVIADKLRKMTPGCEVIIDNLQLEERK